MNGLVTYKPGTPFRIEEAFQLRRETSSRAKEKEVQFILFKPLELTQRMIDRLHPQIHV